MRELSLFTGAGGGVLGSLLLGHRVVGYVEFEGYPQAVLASHIRSGHLDPAPIFGDVRAFVRHHARRFAGRVDLVSAGFPCPPFSVAGKRQGAADERNMWPATVDVLRAVRPPVAFLENVPGLLSVGDGAVEFGRYFGTVLGDLAALGFDAEWTVLGAHDVGAPHQRDRLWILAFSDAGRELLRHESESEPRSIGARIARDDGAPGFVADAGSGRETDGRTGRQAIEREDGEPVLGGSLLVADSERSGRGTGQRNDDARQPDSSRGGATLADPPRRGLGEHGRASGSGGHPHERGPALPDAGCRNGDAGRGFEPGDPSSERPDREPRECGRLLADADGGRRGVIGQPDGEPGLEGACGHEPHRCDGARRVEHAPLPRLEGGGERLPRCGRVGEDAGLAEPGLGRDPHGLADRLEWPASRGEWPSRGDQHAWEPPRVLPRGARTDFRRQRLRAIGNGQVPSCVVAAWRELVGRAVED